MPSYDGILWYCSTVRDRLLVEAADGGERSQVDYGYERIHDSVGCFIRVSRITMQHKR